MVLLAIKLLLGWRLLMLVPPPPCCRFCRRCARRSTVGVCVQFGPYFYRATVRVSATRTLKFEFRARDFYFHPDDAPNSCSVSEVVDPSNTA